MARTSVVLEEYLGAFADPGEAFLTYYSFAADSSPRAERFTRGEFLSLAKKAAGVLRSEGLGRGDCFALHLTGNRVADLAFRLGATMTGAVPVTVNWQADTPDTVVYKLDLTGCRLAVTDAGVEPQSLNALRSRLPGLRFFESETLAGRSELGAGEFDPAVASDDTRIIIFTSGTTGKPKGVRLPYRSYTANRATFEAFLEIGPDVLFAPLIVNPMHHTNSTAITDWALRRPGTRLFLVERYSTQYWRLVTEIAREPFDRIVAPTVSRHFDFLENLRQEGKLPVPLDELKSAMHRVDFLIGSAPVGPTTVARLEEFAGRLPLVRFGSTETCLQVMGTPVSMPPERRLAAFRSGWSHRWKGEGQGGYYVGRPHPPWTECRAVRAIARGEGGYFADCDEGEPGYLITRGDNLMSGYVRNDRATHDVMHEGGWYTGLRDICFWKTNPGDGGRDWYWMSRDSALLIRGGVNYSYDQVGSELKAFVSKRYALADDAFDLAVVGLRLSSEHDDDCCVTIELTGPDAAARAQEIERTFVAEARGSVSKGAKPDRLRIAKIPRNFKGAILVPELKQACESAFRRR